MLPQSQGPPHVPTVANTAAVVVLFNPDGDLLSRLGRVQNQVTRLFVISNDDRAPGRLVGLDPDRLEVVQNGRNLGLAAALNIGLERARRQGFAWCLLLDQDTVIDPDLLSGLAEVYSAYPEQEKVGVLAPNYRSLGGTRVAYRTDVSWQTLPTVVTSGSLIPLGALERTGGLREVFFIEGIDIEFCLRVRAGGLHVVASGRPLMTHGAGAAEERRLFGRTVLVGNHPPWRCYLQYRNLTWILLRYGCGELRWTGSTVVAMFKRIVLVCLFERERGAKLWAMTRGTFRGIGQALSPDPGAGAPS